MIVEKAYNYTDWCNGRDIYLFQKNGFMRLKLTDDEYFREYFFNEFHGQLEKKLWKFKYLTNDEKYNILEELEQLIKE